LNAQPRDDLRATLERERQRLQQIFDTANAALAAREAEIENRTIDLQQRERQLQVREVELETEARDRAAAARGDADELISQARERCEELEQEMLTAEQEMLQAQRSTAERIERMLAEAEARAERVVLHSRQDADVARARIVELLRLREGLLASTRETLSRFSETLARAEQEEPPHLPDGVDEDRAAAHAPRQSDDEDDRALLEQSTLGSQPEKPVAGQDEPAMEDGPTGLDLVEESPAGDESDASRC